MTETTANKVLVPGPDHPITVTPTGSRVTVTRGGRTIADTTRALTLQEATYPAVQYLPIEDVDPAVLAPSDHATYCPYKGDASYYDLTVDGAVVENAVWTYRAPYDAVAEITGHVAFYPNQVDAIEVHAATA
jgi:uncharacterized protein (DUF427 family)